MTDERASIGEQQEFWAACQFYLPAWHPVPTAFVRPKLERIASHCGVGAETTLLDVGCGNGTFTYHWREVAPDTVGVDFSRNMLSMHGRGEKSVQADALQLPFADGAFEVVFESAMLHHIPRPVEAVRELGRVAQRFVALVEPNVLNPGQTFHSLCWPAERMGLRFTLNYLASLGKLAGLSVVSRCSTGMVYERRTPTALLPLLTRLERPFPFAAYNVVICAK